MSRLEMIGHCVIHAKALWHKHGSLPGPQLGDALHEHILSVTEPDEHEVAARIADYVTFLLTHWRNYDA